MTNKEKIIAKVYSIEKVLNSRWRSYDDSSLMTGVGGLPLFYFMLYKLTKDSRYILQIREIVEEFFERLNNEKYGISYSSGITGFAYMFDFLRREKIISDDDISESLESLDEIITNFYSEKKLTIESIDFLHGGLGAANYLLERIDANTEIRNSTITIFENIAKTIDDDIIKTEKVSSLINYYEDTHKTNCGLAHGHISNIIIFSKYLKKYCENELIRSTLKNSVECVLKFKSENESDVSCFPSIAVNRQTAFYNIPMGWCYGDQTASLGLYRASQVLNDNSLALKAKKIALKTLERDTFEKAQLSPLGDAGFCHGASSLAYLHKKWYMITGDKRFQALYEIFIKEVLERGETNLGLAGYRKYMGHDQYEDAIGLLDGVIGIGIVLIDYLLDNNDTEWDRFFLLS